VTDPSKDLSWIMLRVTGHQQTLAVYLIVAVLLAHSAEAKDKSVQDAQKGLRNQCNHSTDRATVDLGCNSLVASAEKVRS